MALLGSQTGYLEKVTSVASATFQRGAVSLPQGHAGRIDPVPLLPKSLQSLLKGSVGFLRPNDEAAEALSQFDGTLAMDSRLKRRGFDYGHLVGQLLQKGISEPGSSAEKAVLQVLPSWRTWAIVHILEPGRSYGPSFDVYRGRLR